MNFVDLLTKEPKEDFATYIGRSLKLDPDLVKKLFEGPLSFESFSMKVEFRRENPTHCFACSAPLSPPSFWDYLKRHERREYHDPHTCDRCAGNVMGKLGVRVPKLGETWVSREGDRVRVIQEYKGGTYGGWAMGETAKGQRLGMRRGSVEKGNWIPFDGPPSTVNDILLGDF